VCVCVCVCVCVRACVRVYNLYNICYGNILYNKLSNCPAVLVRAQYNYIVFY